MDQLEAFTKRTLVKATSERNVGKMVVNVGKSRLDGLESRLMRLQERRVRIQDTRLSVLFSLSPPLSLFH